jgi:hypothetical protein
MIWHCIIYSENARKTLSALLGKAAQGSPLSFSKQIVGIAADLAGAESGVGRDDLADCFEGGDFFVE